MLPQRPLRFGVPGGVEPVLDADGALHRAPVTKSSDRSISSLRTAATAPTRAAWMPSTNRTMNWWSPPSAPGWSTPAPRQPGNSTDRGDQFVGPPQVLGLPPGRDRARHRDGDGIGARCEGAGPCRTGRKAMSDMHPSTIAIEPTALLGLVTEITPWSSSPNRPSGRRGRGARSRSTARISSVNTCTTTSP